MESESSLSVMEAPTRLQGLKSLPIRRVFLLFYSISLLFGFRLFVPHFPQVAIRRTMPAGGGAPKDERSLTGLAPRAQPNYSLIF